MRKKKITQISAIAMAMAMAVTPTANVFAYGETSGNSTLFSDTQKVSDYSTWKDSVWNKKDTEGTLTREGEAYNSSKIILFFASIRFSVPVGKWTSFSALSTGSRS